MNVKTVIPETKVSAILLVDDDGDIRALMKMFLNDVGYDVFLAENGTCGLALYKEHQAEIGLVLLDMRMPGMNGLELFEALQTWDPGVRCMMISASPVNREIDQALHHGLIAHLQKPVLLDRLILQIETVLGAPAPQRAVLKQVQ